MRNELIRRVNLVAVIVCLLGSAHGEAFAQSIKVGTYNLRIAGGNGLPPDPDAEPGPFEQWSLYNWVLTRRFLVFESIEQGQPDFMGFQEAFQRSGPLQVGPTQQESFADVFTDTKWTYLSWGPENANNMNPIIVNTDRFSIVASGTVTVDMIDFLGAAGWTEFFDGHTFFHGNPNGVHSLSPFRYVNWVVADDGQTGGRVAFLTSHYETFIGNNNKGAEFDAAFVVWAALVNSSFGYISEQMIAEGAQLTSDWGPLEVIIGGDFETGDPLLPSQAAFATAGYDETWRVVNGGGRRPTQGIDVMFVKLDNITVDDSYYDQAEYTDGASDHKPLYAELTISASILPVEMQLGLIGFDPILGCALTLDTETGLEYSVQYSEDLEAWILLEDLTGDGTVMDVMDSGAVGQAHRFYRAFRNP